MTNPQELSPVTLVQNSALNSILLWKFGRAYQDESIGDQPILTLLFVVLPIVLHGPTLRVVSSTNQSSGLAKFTTKLAEEREQLLAVHERALSMREMTLQAISTGLSCKLIKVDYDFALVRSNDLKPPATVQRLKPYIAASDKLGKWFARLPSHQVFSLLKVEP